MDEIRHGVELRPHTTEEIVTLVLGHAFFGLAWSRTSLINSGCSDGLVAHGSGDVQVGRVGMVATECGSGSRGMDSVGLMPALLSTFTEVMELA